jgi:hemolysin III
MKRTKLKERNLPVYSRGEEIMNMVTHIVGGAFAIAVLLLCLLKTTNAAAIVGCCIYGAGMLITYTMSSVYHGLHINTGKKVMQVLDHCAIYFLIAGTYTPIMLVKFVPTYPLIGWGLLGMQWALTALAVTLTAIDLKKYRVFSMICYILMGWGIIFFLPQTLEVLGSTGFGWLLSGGIAYTIGAILLGIGKKLKWMHSVFHIFVLLGSALQFISIYFYML